MMIYDIIIIGSGPAGISAALYAKRSNINVLIISMNEGNLHKAELIENYYGLPHPISGAELFQTGLNQVKELGVEVKKEQVVGLEYMNTFLVQTDEHDYEAKAVILATGAPRRTPTIKNLTSLEGKGVSYCAICDAFFYRKRKVVVIGSGEYALHEAKELLNVTDSVTILTNGETINFEMDSRIQVITTPIFAMIGEEKLSAIQFTNETTLPVDGAFIAVGIAGSASFARTLGAEVNQNKIIVDDKMATNIPGLYACGDTTGGLLQIAKAVYEGAMAGLEAVKYVRASS